MIFLIPFIFVKYNSTATDCTENSPCNYTFALSKINDNEKIIISDSKIQEAKHLTDFHFFIANISNIYLNKVEIIGNNTSVDGTLFESLFPSFLCINSIQIDFSNFIFHDFRSTIIYYRNSNNSTLSNIIFDSNCITEQISIFSSVFSTTAISNVTFQNSWQYRSSYLFSSSSHIFFDNCQFENITTPTVEDSFLLMIINSRIELHKSNFTDINFIGSNLFYITSESTLKLNKNQFINNVYNELFLVTQKSELLINTCKLIENRGTILTSHDRSHVRLVNTIFEGNSAIGLTLFLVKKSEITINYDCQFKKNVAETVIKLRGKSGFANITYSDFVGNSATGSLLSSTSQSTFCMTKCLFKSNTANDQLFILSNQAKANLNAIEFNEVRSTVFKICQFSEMNCTDSIFNGFPFVSNSFISVKKSSSLTVISSQFNVQSINGPLICEKVASKVKLIDCIFDGSKDETVRGACECVNCTFRRPNCSKKRSFASISYFKAFYVLMSSFAVFEAGKLIFSCYFYLSEE